jgi:cysteate synthase
MGTTVLSAVSTIGKIPTYTFKQSAAEPEQLRLGKPNLRFIEDGRFGNHKMNWSFKK